jgi:uncharacterized protein (DUF983 family)
MCCPECGSPRLFLRLSESGTSGRCLECGAWFVRTTEGAGALQDPPPIQPIERRAS